MPARCAVSSLQPTSPLSPTGPTDNTDSAGSGMEDFCRVCYFHAFQPTAANNVAFGWPLSSSPSIACGISECTEGILRCQYPQTDYSAFCCVLRYVCTASDGPAAAFFG